MTNEPPNERTKILVAEDEQVVALDLEATLDRIGYQVVGIAPTGAEALQIAEETHPDLVLMDIQLYGAPDGIATAAEIRRRWEIPVVFVTAFASEEVLARARAAGAYGYLTKPFRTKDLNATLTVALEQHRLTKHIFQEHGWLRTLLAGMSDGVIATDVNGEVKYLNTVAEKLTGWTLAEALGRAIEDVYPLRSEDGAPLEQCQLRRVISTNQAIGRQRFVLHSRGGRTIFVEDSAAPIHDAQGRLAGAVAVITDISERREGERERERLMAELTRSNTDLTRFSYTVAHDLQAPLRTVKTFAEMVARDLDLNAQHGHKPPSAPDLNAQHGHNPPSALRQKTAEHLALVQAAASGMERLIRALLQYAQVGEAQLQREWVPVTEVLEQAELSLAALIAETQARLDAAVLPAVWADRTQLQQLLQNLLANAIQYRLPDQPPHISVTSETTQAGWQFAISDNGQGIPPEQLDRVFSPLSRLHGSEVPGTGLGLAICRTIVERHGGRIWADAARQGRGAMIYFLIPTPAPK